MDMNRWRPGQASFRFNHMHLTLYQYKSHKVIGKTKVSVRQKRRFPVLRCGLAGSWLFHYCPVVGFQINDGTIIIPNPLSLGKYIKRWRNSTSIKVTKYKMNELLLTFMQKYIYPLKKGTNRTTKEVSHLMNTRVSNKNSLFDNIHRNCRKINLYLQFCYK